MLCVPVWNRGKAVYLAVPLGYRMWQKTKSKLELATDMVRQVMPEFQEKKNVIILCDGWYVKQSLISIVEEYPNLNLIGNARSNSVLYDLAPESTGHWVDQPNTYAVYPSRKILRYLKGRLMTIIRESAVSLQAYLVKVTYCLRDLLWERYWHPPPVFQHGISGTAPDFLCMAGEISPKPDKKQLDEVFPDINPKVYRNSDLHLASRSDSKCFMPLS